MLASLLNTPDLPSIGSTARASRKSVLQLEEEMRPFLQSSRIEEPSRQLIRAVVLLWHDHLDESHTISQDIQSADGSFLHGIMHRREPDYWNSKYWFNRVGRHPAFPTIATRV